MVIDMAEGGVGGRADGWVDGRDGAGVIDGEDSCADPPSATATRSLRVGWLRGGIRTHRHVFIVVSGFIAISALFDVAYPIVRGNDHMWFQAVDLVRWLRASQYIVWGWIGGVYTSGTGVLSLPGLALVLTPVAWLTNVMHLTESFPFVLKHPSSWPPLYLYALCMSAIPLVSLDSLALRLGYRKSTRIWLTVGEALLLWQVIAWYGHPEDALALGFAIWAVLASKSEKYEKSGWLMGVGLCFQPLVIVIVPILWSQFPDTKRKMFILRSALFPAVLVGTFLASNPHGTWLALHEQLSSPQVNHATPWAYIASKSGRQVAYKPATRVVVNGSARSSLEYFRAVRAPRSIQQGFSNLLIVFTAGCIGLWLSWKKVALRLAMLVWIAALALSIRTVFEPVMISYYFWPYSALALVVLAGTRRRWAFSGFALMIVQIFLGFVRVNPWIWWTPQLLLSAAVLTIAWRGAKERDLGDPEAGREQDWHVKERVKETSS